MYDTVTAFSMQNKPVHLKHAKDFMEISVAFRELMRKKRKIHVEKLPASLLNIF